jgi:transketolase
MLKNYVDFNCKDNSSKPGRNIHFGIREHAMGAAVNGMALHGGVIPYSSTFFVFSDYMRPAIRMAAIMETHSIFIFSHDSIGVGEDGPTHQPIEHLMSLRAMPNLIVLRPADANETVAAWQCAITLKKPVCIILSRQKLPVFDQTRSSYGKVMKGAYILSDCKGVADIILLASGSEVHLLMQAQAKLMKKGINARVVSMPSWELFSAQPESYRDKVLPPQIKVRLAVEAGSTHGWHKWVGCDGDVIGIDQFGASAPGPLLMDKYGFTADNIFNRSVELLKK